MDAIIHKNFFNTMYLIDTSLYFGFLSFDIHRLMAGRHLFGEVKKTTLRKAMKWLRIQYSRETHPDVWRKSKYYHRLRKDNLILMICTTLDYVHKTYGNVLPERLYMYEGYTQ